MRNYVSRFYSTIIIVALLMNMIVGIIKIAESVLNVKEDSSKEALVAYERLLRSDTIRWDYDGSVRLDPCIIETEELDDYCLVSLCDMFPPVLFLKTDQVGASEGTTRMLIYDEELKKPMMKLGEGWNCIYLTGYILPDEENPFPIIYAYGGRQDVIHEMLYYFDGKSVSSLGAAHFINPGLANYDPADLLYPYITDNDSYEWNGKEVKKEQYYKLRDALVKRLTKIEWIPFC